MSKDAFDFWRLRTPCLMGIVNVTPDSFSDGGQFLPAAAAVERVATLVKAGAELLDLGAEASSFFRPGVQPVEPEEQLHRLRPVVKELQYRRTHGGPHFFFSIDTRSSFVAREMLRSGAEIINDISAGEHDEAMFRTVAEMGGAMVLMHIGAGYPATPKQEDPDIVATVRTYLRQRVAAAVAAGIPLRRIAVDPGVGFGKTMADNWRLAMRAQEFSALGVPVVLGGSRKRFLETPGASVKLIALAEQLGAGRTSAHSRDAMSAALIGAAARNGVQIHRVHEVALAREGIRLASSASGRTPKPI